MAKRIPSLRLHKQSRLWRATFGDHTVYYERDEAASRAAYELDLARYLASRRQRSAPPTISQLVVEVLTDARERYVMGPQHNSEANTLMYALRFLETKIVVKLPDRPAEEVDVLDLLCDEFTAIHLEAIKQQMIVRRRSWSYVNSTLRRIRLAFSRGRVMGLVSAETVEDLRCVESVRRGQRHVVVHPPVVDAPAEHIEAMKRYLRPMPRALIEVLQHSVLRAGEVLAMTVASIDTTTDPWVYDLGKSHKTFNATGQAKRKFLGGRCQETIRPYYEAAMATHDLNAPLWPSYGESAIYLRSSLRDAVARACVCAKVPHIHPHQIRHRGVTDEYERAAAEALKHAQAAAGHQSASASARYTHSELLDRVRAQRHG